MEDAPMAPKDPNDRQVLTAIRKGAGAKVLTASSLAKATGLDEATVRGSLASLRADGYLTHQSGMVWQSSTSLLKLNRRKKGVAS
jgi:DNA-binding IclR family transcriptional regulator